MDQHVPMYDDSGHPVDDGSNGGDPFFARRLIGAAVALFASAVLVVAWWSTPSSEGLGTHTQLGLPSCGWISTMQTPCVTCGMTTSFAFAADGSFLASFQTQPFGFLLAMGTAMALIGGMYTAATGANVGILLKGVVGWRFWWTVAGLAAAAWVYKVLSYKGIGL